MKPHYPTCLSAVAVLLTACVTPPPPVKVSSTVTVPTDLLRLTCERVHPTKDAHWDGVADLVRSTDGRVIGVHCSYTTMEAGLATVAFNIDIRTPLAHELRAFLAAAGVTSSGQIGH